MQCAPRFPEDNPTMRHCHRNCKPNSAVQYSNIIKCSYGNVYDRTIKSE